MTSKLKAALAGFVFFMATVLIIPIASAKTMVSIGGKHSSAEIKSKCKEAGGRYFEGDFTYGCTNDTKDTEVICDKGNGKCHGYVPIMKALGGANRGGPGLEILR